MNARAGAKKRGNDLSADDLIRTTVELLDEGGIAAFSMRTLAQRIGRSTMAAYRHVQDRETLIHLAAESVQHDLPPLEGLLWYERLEAVTRHGWFTCWRVHPWVVDYLDRGGMTPRTKDRLVVMEQIFRDAGFDEREVSHALEAHWSLRDRHAAAHRRSTRFHRTS